MERVILVYMGRLARSGAVRPLRQALRRVVGPGAYDRVRVAVRQRVEAVGVELHADVLPLIEQLDRGGVLAPGAARKLRSVARGIPAEARRDARV